MRLEDIKMADYLTPGKTGIYEIDHFEIDHDPSEEEAKLYDMPPRGEYTRLLINNVTYMSDTPMERETNRIFVQKAFGDVLIGGLGLGMIVLAIQDLPQVRSITIVELHEGIINLVGDQLPLNAKVNIIAGDVFTYQPSDLYDIIYLDIWKKANRTIWEKEMVPLKKRYNKYLKSRKEDQRRRVFCWAENIAKKSNLLGEEEEQKWEKIVSFARWLHTRKHETAVQRSGSTDKFNE